MFTRNLISVTGKRNVPLQLGLAAYCTLVDSFVLKSVIAEYVD